MNYTGKLYGKVGRTYIPLVMTSDDVDDMEKKLTEVTLLSEGRLTLLNNQEQRHESERNQARQERDDLKRLLENILREDVEGQDYKDARKYLARMKGGDQ